MPSPRSSILVLFVLNLLLWCATAHAERRVALVIGNASYATAPLKNPVNDARDMAASLKSLGFDVSLVTDATMQQMETAVREFGQKLRQGGVGLFYYAGHGVQVAGENYLIPVYAVIQSEGDVKFGALNAGLVLAKMEDAGNGVNVVILDACRSNPYARSFRTAELGLAKMDAPTGSLIAYSTSPGRVASDGGGKNGLYTHHLLKNIATSGLSVEELFKRVRQGVAGDSAKKQVPWEASSLIGQFSFAGGAQTASLDPGALAPPPPAPTYSTTAPPKPKPLDLKAEKKRLADEAALLKREKDELALFLALQAERDKLEAERQKLSQAKADAEAAAKEQQQFKEVAPLPKQPPQVDPNEETVGELVGIPAFLVNLTEPAGRRYLKIAMNIEVNDKGTAEQFNKNLPKVMTSLISLLSSKTYKALGSIESNVLLKKEIVERLTKIFGENKVLRVYITEIAIQ